MMEGLVDHDKEFAFWVEREVNRTLRAKDQHDIIYIF